MRHIHAQLRFLPILVSALIQWLVGALWYSPALFGRPWMAELGIDPQGHSKEGLVRGMMVSLAASLLLSFVLAHSIIWSGAPGFAAGVFIGFLNWLGFIAAPQYAQGLHERRTIKLFFINTGYWLAAMMITGGMLAVWH